jgi:mannose-6-phosphate isomerase
MTVNGFGPLGLLRAELGELTPFAAEQRRVDKPWGYELIWALSEHYCGKILYVTAGEQLSLQYHRRKDETLYVAMGRAEIEIGNADERSVAVVEPGAGVRIRPGIVHRMRALEDTLFLEVSTPELEDVVRIDDLYGRA